MKTSIRSQQIASVIQQHLPILFQQFTAPDEFGFITIIDIDVSVDLKYADVFIKSLNAPKGFLKRLNKIAPKLAYEVSSKSQIKPITLRFKQDSSTEMLDKINQFNE